MTKDCQLLHFFLPFVRKKIPTGPTHFLPVMD